MSFLVVGENPYLNFYYKSIFENIFNTSVESYLQTSEIPFIKLQESQVIIADNSDSLFNELSSKFKDKIIFNNKNSSIPNSNSIHPLDIKRINFIIKEKKIKIKKINKDFYIKIPIFLLNFFKNTPCQFYTKRHSLSFDLLYSTGQPLNSDNSRIKSLYIKKEDYPLLMKFYIKEFQKNKNKIINDNDIKSYIDFAYNLKKSENLNIPESLIYDIIGELTNTIANINANKNASEILDLILSKKNFFTRHSFYTLFMSCFLYKNIFNKNDYYKFIISSIFHDFKLDPDKNIILEENFNLSNDNFNLNKKFNEHTREAITIIKKLNINDDEIFSMIEEHHNVPSNNSIKLKKDIKDFSEKEFIFNISHYTSLIASKNNNKHFVLEKVLIYQNKHPLFQRVLEELTEILI